MHTMRLRSIQQPKSVDRLLELLITGTNRVPESSYQLRTRSALPHDLKSVVERAQRRHLAWSAWTDDQTTWVFVGEMSLTLSRERGMPVLEIHTYSDRGGLLETAFWAQDKQGNWQRCAD